MSFYVSDLYLCSKMSSNVENQCVVVYANIPSDQEYEDLAEALILRKLAAAISVVPDVTTFKASRKREVKKKYEVILVIKTRKSLVDRVAEFITLNCPYKDEKVDVTSVPIDNGNQPYLKWVYQVSDATPNSSSTSSSENL